MFIQICLNFAEGVHIINKNNMFHSFYRWGNQIFLQIFKAKRRCTLSTNAHYATLMMVCKIMIQFTSIPLALFTLQYTSVKVIIPPDSYSKIKYVPMLSVPITTKVVSLNPAHVKVYSIQHYVIKFVSDLRHVSGFLRVLLFPPPIKQKFVESCIKHHSPNPNQYIY